MEGRDSKTIVLFDVDGPLTKARQKMEQPMIDTLLALKKKVYIGAVGGSDLNKITEQFGPLMTKEFDYIFKCWCILNPRYYYAIEKTMQTSNLC